VGGVSGLMLGNSEIAGCCGTLSLRTKSIYSIYIGLVRSGFRYIGPGPLVYASGPGPFARHVCHL